MLDADRVAVSAIFALFAWVMGYAWVHAGDLQTETFRANLAQTALMEQSSSRHANNSFHDAPDSVAKVALACSAVRNRKECKSLQHCRYHTAKGCVLQDQHVFSVIDLKYMIVR